MDHSGIALHNVAEVRAVAGGGLALQRIPEAVRVQLNQTAQYRARQPDNCELRFVADGPVRITLSAEGETDLVVFFGGFDARIRQRIGRTPVTVEIPPLGRRLTELDPVHLRGQPFARHVRRVIFGGRQREPIILHAVDGAGLRPPIAAELPRRRYLAYGTSITQGFDCEAPHLSYAALTARRLGADLVNLGLGGACHCEAAMAEHLAARTDWDIASLELSVNMMEFPLDEFRRRVGHLVRAVAGADPRRPVMCITLFPFFCDLGVEDPGAVRGGRPDDYRRILREEVAGAALGNLHLSEGPDLFGDLGGLTADLIHPGDVGMAEIAGRLGPRLAALLDAPP